jgi:hypothetical protein
MSFFFNNKANRKKRSKKKTNWYKTLIDEVVGASRQFFLMG